jgi:hypothetical protein
VVVRMSAPPNGFAARFLRTSGSVSQRFASTGRRETDWYGLNA